MVSAFDARFEPWSGTWRVCRFYIIYIADFYFITRNWVALPKGRKALFRILKINMVYILSFVVYIRWPLLFWGLGHYLTKVSRRLVNGAGRALLHLGKCWSGYILGDPGAVAQKYRIVPTASGSPRMIRIVFYVIIWLSHKDWELPNSRIWLAEIDIDSSLDFPI